ncbi:MAG: polysaccharide pyruvyl transferase family protein [Bacteroides sp.]|uniref:polysaccharide pyruvyl transferase family protein n=1 Tax=Bacteroides sp. TaxID=29523 RepID=UPI002FCB5B43
MKRVGIVTIHNSPNYGACLQSFALCKYIEQQGAYCEIIDIRRPVHEDYVYEKHYSSYRNNPFSLKKKIRNTIKKLLGRNTKVNQFTSARAEKRFELFNSSIHYSQPYAKLSDLARKPPHYDVYISGSDQLWNPAQPYCLEPYFLTFVPQDQTKISYATSIGITELTSKEKSDFKKWLNSYKAVSVREKQGQTLLESFMTKEVETVADPTFLLDVEYWKGIAQYPAVSNEYIVVFLLSRNQEVVDYVIRLSKESRLKLIFMKINALPESDDYTIDNEIGPREFLGYLSKANMVITDSFHCTVFSILMGANNFFTYINPLSQRGSRITDLLQTFGLEKHLLPTNFKMGYNELVKEQIDKERVNLIIEKEKLKSRSFLNKWIR